MSNKNFLKKIITIIFVVIFIKYCPRIYNYILEYNIKKEFNSEINKKKYLELFMEAKFEIDEGNYKEAEKILEKATKYHNEAYLKLGELYFNYLNNEKIAEEKFKIALDKGNGRATYFLGEIYRKRNDFKNSKKWFEKGKMYEDDFSKLELAKILKSEKKYDEAENILLHIKNDEANRIYELITLYHYKQDDEKIEYWKKRLFEKEGMENITYDMIEQLNNMENNKEIFEMYDKAEDEIVLLNFSEAEKIYTKMLNIDKNLIII